MNKTLAKSKSSAFTLIELLVVIAIIGILAGLLFPAITGALVSANALKVGNNGKNIVLAIISSNTEREAMSMGSVWPSMKSTIADGTTQKDYSTGDAEVYFADLIDSKTVDNLSWFVFAGAGVPAATDVAQFKTGGFNVWNYIGAMDDSTADDTPFLFSRNFQLATGDLASFSAIETIDNNNAFGEKLSPSIKPFNDVLVVFIQKGGAMQNLKKKFLKNAKLFFGSSIFDSTINKNAKIVIAKGSTAGG